MILALWYHTILAFFFAVLAILLMIVILLQRGKGVGLAGAFGGTGGATAFGAKTGDVLTWVTIVGAAVLLTFTVVLNYVFVEGGSGLRSAAPAAPMPTGGVPAPTPGGAPVPVRPMPRPTPTGVPGPAPVPVPAPPAGGAPAQPPGGAPAAPPVQPEDAGQPGASHLDESGTWPQCARLPIFGADDA